jgi:hypothetical protein
MKAMINTVEIGFFLANKYQSLLVLSAYEKYEKSIREA